MSPWRAREASQKIQGSWGERLVSRQKSLSALSPVCRIQQEEVSEEVGSRLQLNALWQKSFAAVTVKKGAEVREIRTGAARDVFISLTGLIT